MSGPARTVRLAAILAALALVGMIIVTKGWLEPAGLPILDMRFSGYDLEAVQAYLSSLGAEGRSFYTGVYHRLDTAFLILTTFMLGGVIWLHTPHLNSAIRLLLLTVPAGYLMLDLGENALVGALLADQYVVSQSVVTNASQLTQAKWLMLLAGVLLALGSWWIGRGTAQGDAR